MERKIILNTGVVLVKDNKVLLVQQSQPPFANKWNFPLGQVEMDEIISNTAIRETKEETGFDIKLENFLGVYQNLPDMPVNVVIIMFKATTVSGELNFDEQELMGAQWFTLNEVNILRDDQLFHPEMRNVIKRAFEDPRNLDNYVKF